MGKSTSCLRFIACGGSSVESNEAGPVDQIPTKSLKVKKGWSFKKKSSTSQAVTNSAIAETPSLEQKENIQSTANESIVSEKDSSIQLDEKTPPSPQVATDLCVPDVDKYSETEKRPTTASADSYVAADDVSVPKTEKQSDPVDLCVTDGLTDPKNGQYEAVLAVNESDVVIIQSAVRGLLADKELKSIIKLQAMVRGHLVRGHAVGALRCVHAIAKMQVMVRARYAHTRKDGTPSKSKPEITYTSITDLLKNSFARQLFESSPKSKQNKIKCDPLSRDSTWLWLERWTSLASPGAVDDLNERNEMVQEVKHIGQGCEEKNIHEEEEKIIVDDYQENEIFLDAKDFVDPSSSGKFSKLDITEEKELTNIGELTSTNSDMDSFSASLVESAAEKDSVNHPVNEKQDISEEIETVESDAEKDSVNHQLNVTASKYSQQEIESETEQARKPETEVAEIVELGEELKTEVEAKVVQVQTKTEDIVSGSQEQPNNMLVTESELVSAPLLANLSDSVARDAGVIEPAVVYHDSTPMEHEVEERPVSVPKSAMDYISSPQNVETEEVVVTNCSKIDLNDQTAISSEDDIIINHREESQAEHTSNQVCESECVTELSISSTLDSPDRLEIEPLKVELDRVDSTGARSQGVSETNTGTDAFETESGLVDEGKANEVDCRENATAQGMVVDEKEHEKNEAALHLPTKASDQSKANVSDLNTEPEGNTERILQASPGSQVTFSESQGTPSSQVSISTKSKTGKSEKSGSIKRTILSAAKKSPVIKSDGKHESDGKHGSEQQSKEKSAKRQTSFGSPKPEVSDQEHRRDSSTSSSLPSYMQATKSAKAKANAAGHSPLSSPDVADKEIFLRKRHSLSGTKDKQDSPRLQRTSSQAHSGSKSNGTSPLERKWQR